MRLERRSSPRRSDALITSNSGFEEASFSLLFVHYLRLGVSSGSRHCLPLLKILWHVSIAHSIRAMRACRGPQLPMLFALDLLDLINLNNLTLVDRSGDSNLSKVKQ